MHTVALRLSMVYGPGNKGNVLKLIDAAEKNRKLPLGKVRNRRSMVYVGNVVAAALAAMEAPGAAGGVYLVCDERPYGSGELYASICRAMGKEPLLRNVPVSVLKLMGYAGSAASAVLRRPMPVDRDVIMRLTGDLCFSAQKIRRDTGFEPAVGLDEGIARTVEWYRAGCPPTP
jgi:nucleoside-diphosphate-sugar epimerase